MFRPKRIYLDYASITPIDKKVGSFMSSLSSEFANPSSLYTEGMRAKNLIQEARRQIASFLKALPQEIVFTSGGTEGNNMAILGTFLKVKEEFASKKLLPHMIVSSIEHSSVLECARFLETQGVLVTYVEPNEEGIIDPKTVREALRKETVLVSVHLANNEIGVIEPIEEIAKAIRHFKKHVLENHDAIYPLLHTDACQAFNFVPIDTLKLHVDFLTLDGSKVYGPRGIGVLYVKKNTPLAPISFGGGQEMGLRHGTENTVAIYGLGKALMLANTLREKESIRLLDLQTYFLKKLKTEVPHASLNGSITKRLPNNINFCIKGLDAEFAVLQFDVYGISISSASSCLSNTEMSLSYVVKSLHPDCARSSLRISFGRQTKKKHIDTFFKILKKVLKIQNCFKA